MDTFIFNLKRPIITPTPGISGALTVFPQTKFGLTYTAVPNPKQSSMAVSLRLVHLETGREYPLNNFDITEEGFQTNIVLNQAELDAWDAAHAALITQWEAQEALIAAKQAEIALLIDAEQDVPKELYDELTVLEADFVKIKDDVVALGERQVAQYLYINKYSDVIKYFDNRGAITEEGLLWARNIPFFGSTLGDFLADK